MIPSLVTVSSIKIIQNPNASVAHQFDILSYQVLSPLPTVTAPSLENLSEDFLRAQIRGTWGRWGDKGGKSRSGGGGWVWCKPASNNDFLTLLAACWTAAFKHKSRQRLIPGEFHSRVFKTKDTHKFQGKQFSSCSAPDWYQVINGFPRKVQGPKS